MDRAGTTSARLAGTRLGSGGRIRSCDLRDMSDRPGDTATPAAVGTCVWSDGYNIVTTPPMLAVVHPGSPEGLEVPIKHRSGPGRHALGSPMLRRARPQTWIEKKAGLAHHAPVWVEIE